MKINEASMRPKELHDHYAELLSDEIRSFFISTDDDAELKKDIAEKADKLKRRSNRKKDVFFNIIMFQK
jgi:hypothetical protein